MNIIIVPFIIENYDDVYELWASSSGVGLSDADSKENIHVFINRNPGLSMVALIDENLVGACLAGHDGRRGYIHHLAVADRFRRHGIGRKLVTTCLGNLEKCGISKCHLFLFQDNQQGRRFWESLGWAFRHDLGILSKSI